MEAVEYYSSIAPSYEALYKEEQLTKIKRVMALLKPKKNWKILDIGAGTGLLEEKLRGYKITAIEPSEMADLLEAKKLRGVEVVREKISRFKSDKRFDAVFCLTVLQDLDKKERAKCIKAAFNLCRKGGKVIFSVLKVSPVDLSNLRPDISEEIANDRLYIFTKR